jgi:hypothetical protein
MNFFFPCRLGSKWARLKIKQAGFQAQPFGAALIGFSPRGRQPRFAGRADSGAGQRRSWRAQRAQTADQSWGEAIEQRDSRKGSLVVTMDQFERAVPSKRTTSLR